MASMSPHSVPNPRCTCAETLGVGLQALGWDGPQGDQENPRKLPPPSMPQPGLAGNRTHRDLSQDWRGTSPRTPKAGPSQQWRGTAPKCNSGKIGERSPQES